MNSVTLSRQLADSLLPLFIIFGIIGGFRIIANACVLCVYKHKYPKSNFRTFVLCLSIIDLTGLLFVVPSELYSYRFWFDQPMSAAWFCKLKNALTALDVITSSLILLLISIERYRKVCHPLQWQVNTKTAFRLCLVIVGTGILIVIPCPIIYDIQEKNITYAGESLEVKVCQEDDE